MTAQKPARPPLLRVERFPGNVEGCRVIEFWPDERRTQVHVIDVPPPPSSSLEWIVDQIDDREAAGRLAHAKPTPRVINSPTVAGAYGAPLKLFLDLTHRCQIACSFCLSDSGRRRTDEMSPDDAISILQEAAHMGVMYAKLGGGEPTLFPSLPDVLDAGNAAGLALSMSTNSLWADESLVDAMARNRVLVSVSLAGTRVTNDRFMRRKGHFDAALAKTAELRSSGVQVRFRLTLMPLNLAEVPELVELAAAAGVPIKFSYCRPAGRATRGDHLISPHHRHQYAAVLEYLNRSDLPAIVELDEGMQAKHPRSLALIQGLDNACGAGRRSMHIDPSGIARACVFLGDDYRVGVWQAGSLAQMWAGTDAPGMTLARSIPTPADRKSTRLNSSHRT